VKVIVTGNAPWAPTGYGQQVDLLTRSLSHDGHDVAIAPNYGLQGAQLEWHGMPVMPPGYDVWGNDTIQGHASAFFGKDPGWVISLMDVWIARGPAWKNLDVASWVPIDHLPTPPRVAAFFDDNGAIPIAMSRFGERQLQNVDLDPLYAPHGVNTQVFRPDIDTINGLTPRQIFGIEEDRFVVVMNAANKGIAPPRKAFPQAFAAFGIFAREHDDAVLLVHSERTGMADGVNLNRLAEACGIPDEQIIFVDQYAYRVGLSAEMIAGIYNAGDVLLAPSMGEGFGIPVIEAQACGLPVIVSDFSAQPELVGAGWTVGGIPFWDEAQGSWLHLPAIGEIKDALEEAYNGNYAPQDARRKALEYDHDRVFDTYWKPIMATLDKIQTDRPLNT